MLINILFQTETLCQLCYVWASYELCGVGPNVCVCSLTGTTIYQSMKRGFLKGKNLAPEAGNSCGHIQLELEGHSDTDF